MPRVTYPPRANHGPSVSPQKQSPVKIPLNDDRQEKAIRLQSRQALHDLQMNQIKAAASPMRKTSKFERASIDSPQTPQGYHNQDKESKEDGGLLAVVAGGAMTPMKRVPILANFEEWMKMATDNKINATNSWNFALIDYFHDMSLLKDGDGVNFQKASCTLDGCVKIYTSRVDSVATETGKLLSGLADSGNKHQRRSEDEIPDEDVDEHEGEDGARSRAKKRIQRSSEATLASSFTPLQLKKFELEFSVDPLFKKASADFDEGGAKGLLLNHLAIDGHGRIVFDSSDDVEATSSGRKDVRRRSNSKAGDTDTVMEDDEESSNQSVGTGNFEDENVDLPALKAKFFPDLEMLDSQDICPSLKSLDLGDPKSSLELPFLKAPEELLTGIDDMRRNPGDRSGIILDDENSAGFDEDDGLFGGCDLPSDAGFGDGGEAWAKDAALDPQLRLNGPSDINGVGSIDDGTDEADAGGFKTSHDQFSVALHHKRYQDTHENILSYFDNALRKHWAGPEHWRIRRVKNLIKDQGDPPLRRKEKEPFEIDFISPLGPGLADLIYTPAASHSTTCLPRAQWTSKTRNLLPDDKHFNSRQLLQLFLKPKARVGSRQSPWAPRKQHSLERTKLAEQEEVDEAFWARQDAATADNNTDEFKDPKADYDADFFQDDGMAFPGALQDEDEDDFADAREAFSSGLRGPAISGTVNGLDAVLATQYGSQEGAYGSQLVTQSKRLRPEYVQYARVAKKVDVRRLKEEMWKGIGFEETFTTGEPEHLSSEAPKDLHPPLKFTAVINNLQTIYPKQAMADISTSYCFICLLHLANEKGLVLGNEIGLEELSIVRDFTAEITEG
ncbi:hypothetical protein MMC13_003359 [Lambiella insularis]|nr:hypothetical protein [Lambiella insularis]